MLLENSNQMDTTSEETQNVTLGQPLSDLLLQLEDYTPTVSAMAKKCTKTIVM